MNPNIDYIGDAHGAIFWIIIGIIVLIIHFVPSFIAYSKDHDRKGLILILNILMGWTGIGWLILMIWALAGKK